MKKLVAIASLAVMLTACSDGPSDADIQDVLTRVTERELMMTRWRMMLVSIEINSIENSKCEESGAGKYKCTYDITSTSSSQMKREPSEETRTQTTEFEDRADGWHPVSYRPVRLLR